MKRVILLSALIIGMFSNAAFSADWELQATNDTLGIEIYTREVTDSDFLEYRGVTRVNTGLKPVVALIADVDAAPKWMFNMISSKTVKVYSQHEDIVYSLNESGPLLADRDSLVRSVLTQDEESKVITIKMTNEPTFLPEVDGIVRISELYGIWKLTPQEGGVTEVEYQMYVDPAGDLPAGIVNAFVVDEPLHTLTGMHQHIGFYHDTPVPYISD